MPEDLKSLLDFHEEFAKMWIAVSGSLSPHVIVRKGNTISSYVLVGKKKDIKRFLTRVEQSQPDWVVFLAEAYSKTYKASQFEYRPGDHKAAKEAGDETVKDIIVIQAYSREGKLLRELDKETLKRIGDDGDDFEGWLTIDLNKAWPQQ